MNSIFRTRDFGPAPASSESDPPCAYLDKLLDNYEQFMLRRGAPGPAATHSDKQHAA